MITRARVFGLTFLVAAASFSALSDDALAADLDFTTREFKTTWRKKGTGNKIIFDKSRQTFAVEFGGVFAAVNTSDASYSRCTSGRDGGANLCVSGRSFDCSFFATMSVGKIANLDLRRSGGNDNFCNGMAGDYEILLD